MKTEPTIGCGSLEGVTTSLGAAPHDSTKPLRYMDRNGEDWIDDFSKTATIDEFRGAMKFVIGKYNRRAGKKDDLISEIRKMRDYCDRWISYEEGLNE